MKNRLIKEDFYAIICNVVNYLSKIFFIKEDVLYVNKGVLSDQRDRNRQGGLL